MNKFWFHFRERFVNFYLPLLGAGIRSYTLDERTVRSEMKLTLLNKNLVNVHFGGSLYAMCDPWFMLILIRLLGPDYIVWDKAASIKFIRPGRSKVTATFHVPQERVDEILANVQDGKKYEPTFEVDVFGEDGQVVAHVEKLLYVRKKDGR